jgi:hypothetical protein
MTSGGVTHLDTLLHQEGWLGGTSRTWRGHATGRKVAYGDLWPPRSERFIAHLNEREIRHKRPNSSRSNRV